MQVADLVLSRKNQKPGWSQKPTDSVSQRVDATFAETEEMQNDNVPIAECFCHLSTGVGVWLLRDDGGGMMD